jgi:hypothetical protein
MATSLSYSTQAEARSSQKISLRLSRSFRAALPTQIIQETATPDAEKNACRNVRLGSLADIVQRPRHVRFTPDSRHSVDELACPFCAKSRHWRSKGNCSHSRTHNLARCGHNHPRRRLYTAKTPCQLLAIGLPSCSLPATQNTLGAFLYYHLVPLLSGGAFSCTRRPCYSGLGAAFSPRKQVEHPLRGVPSNVPPLTLLRKIRADAPRESSAASC